MLKEVLTFILAALTISIFILTMAIIIDDLAGNGELITKLGDIIFGKGDK